MVMVRGKTMAAEASLLSAASQAESVGSKQRKERAFKTINDKAKSALMAKGGAKAPQVCL